MRSTSHGGMLALALTGCANLIGIRALPSDGGVGDGAQSGPCTGGTMIVSVPVVLDELTVSNGYVYARPTNPMSGLYTGAMRCATSATCMAAPSIIAIGSDEFDEFAVGTKLAYTLDST